MYDVSAPSTFSIILKHGRSMVTKVLDWNEFRLIENHPLIPRESKELS